MAARRSSGISSFLVWALFARLVANLALGLGLFLMLIIPSIVAKVSSEPKLELAGNAGFWVWYGIFAVLFLGSQFAKFSYWGSLRNVYRRRESAVLAAVDEGERTTDIINASVASVTFLLLISLAVFATTQVQHCIDSATGTLWCLPQVDVSAADPGSVLAVVLRLSPIVMFIMVTIEAFGLAAFPLALVYVQRQRSHTSAAIQAQDAPDATTDRDALDTMLATPLRLRTRS